MDEYRLKNCPFCASNNIARYRSVAGDIWRIHCEDCGAESGKAATEDETAAKWNERRKTKTVEELEAIISHQWERIEDRFLPDWNEAPDWAQWHAVDEDGDGFWYQEKPIVDGDIWRRVSTDTLQKRTQYINMDGWTHSLRKRPERP